MHWYRHCTCIGYALCLRISRKWVVFSFIFDDSLTQYVPIYNTMLLHDLYSSSKNLPLILLNFWANIGPFFKSNSTLCRDDKKQVIIQNVRGLTHTKTDVKSVFLEDIIVLSISCCLQGLGRRSTWVRDRGTGIKAHMHGIFSFFLAFFFLSFFGCHCYVVVVSINFYNTIWKHTFAHHS